MAKAGKEHIEMRINGIQGGASTESSSAVNRQGNVVRAESRRTIRTLVAATLLGLVLAGCTSSPQTQPSDPPGVDFWDAFSNHTLVIVHLAVKGRVDIIYTFPGPASMGSDYWKATIADPSIVSFSPANPGRTNIPMMFTGLKKGETTAVLTYTGGATPESVTFDITVGTP